MNVFLAVMMWAARLMIVRTALITWAVKYYLNRRYSVTGRHAQPTPLMLQVFPLAAVITARILMKSTTARTIG